MPNRQPTDREAALDRVKKAQAAVAAALPLMSGRQASEEDRLVLKAATQELHAATLALEAAGGAQEDAAVSAAIADLQKRAGTRR